MSKGREEMKRAMSNEQGTGYRVQGSGSVVRKLIVIKARYACELKFRTPNPFFELRPLFIRLFTLCVLLAAIGNAAWARGKIETVTAEGTETWRHNFDIKGRRKGTYNFIVNAEDHAGNESVSGPFNIKIDPNSGLPRVKVIFPENGSVVRQNINVLGTAKGYFDIEKVSVRLDSGETLEAEGKEYWSRMIEFNGATDGKGKSRGITDGKHALYIKATDANGSTGPEQRIDFIFDTSPPKIDILSHKIGDTISSNVSIRGRATDANGIRSMELSEDGKSYTRLDVQNLRGLFKSLRKNTSINFEIPVKARELPDGAKVYHVRATDTTGAVTVKQFMFYIKSGLPALEIYTPMPDEPIAGMFLLSGRAYSQAGIAQLSIEWGKMKSDINISPDDPYWGVPLEVAKDSPRTIKVTAKDRAGKTVSVNCQLDDLRIDGEADLPRKTNIEFLFPRNNEVVSGTKTVIGFIEHPTPISNINYTFNGRNFEEISYISRQGKAWFTFVCDFTGLKASNGKLSFRFTDAKGANIEGAPEYTLGSDEVIPLITLNTPWNNDVITGNFNISGITGGAAPVQSVHWRFLGPKLESIPKGEVGKAATEAALAFMANSDVPFSEAGASKVFSVPVDFATLTDGDYTCEVFIRDRNGVQSDTVSRAIKVSTAAPETQIITPPITRYNSQVILVRGYSGDANGLRSVRVSMDGGLTWQEANIKEDCHWELPLNTAIYTDKVYSAYIIAEDTCGIASYYTAMINIDNNPPNVVITSPYTGQYVGTEMPIIGRVSDKIEIKSLNFQVFSVINPNNKIAVDVEPQPVIFETVSLESFRAGEYIVRVIAKDLADNETVVSRKVFYDPNNIDAQIAIYSPLPGEEHTGPVYVAGLVTGTYLPETVQLMLDGEEFQELTVDRYGVFRYDISEAELETAGPHKIYAFFKTDKGRTIASANHTVYYSHYGPVLLIDSHRDGDVITDRPWLRGQAMFVKPPHPEGRDYTRAEGSRFSVKRVEVSYDNGRTFKRATGKGEWRWRLEPLDLPPGTQPVVVRATFENDEQAVRRVLLFVDVEHPQVETVSPEAKSVHRDELYVYGDASDNFELTDVNISLRPFSKFWYSVPEAIRGLYFDVKTLGAVYFDVGVGLSLFDNNVRFQGQYGRAPPDEDNSILVDSGRYTGEVWGIKLVANIATIPFDWLFKDRDWAYYKMNIGVGAIFTWFSMEGNREPLYMGAVIAQIDIANIDFKLIYPNWNRFHVWALYMQPEFWFASTDAIDVDKIIPRIGIGIRVNVF
jgi:hypothetical protein